MPPTQRSSSIASASGLSEFITSTITGIEKSALIAAWFSVWGGEVLSLALIKIFKIKDNGEKLEFYKDE